MTLIAICLILGFALSLRVNVVTLAVVALLGGISVFGISMLLGDGLISSAWRFVVSVACLEAGYFLGLLAQAARLIMQEQRNTNELRGPPRNESHPDDKSAS